MKLDMPLFPPSTLSAVASLELELGAWDLHPRLASLSHKGLFARGKKLRPSMLFLFGELLGLKTSELRPYAEVIEIVHGATLAHDDVIDEANERRGAPSLNALSSNKKAVLAGDYLLAYALGRVSELGHLKLVQELSHTIADLAEGEWRQLDGINVSVEAQRDIARLKTGSVIRWCYVVPAVLKGWPDPYVEKASQLGELIGVIFQLTDDILDLERSDATQGADLKNGVINAVYAAMLELSSLSHPSTKTLEELSQDGPLRALAVKKVRDTVNQLSAEAMATYNECIGLLPDSTPEHQIEAVRALIHYVGHRV